MRVVALRATASLLTSFQPHLHREGCAVCSAAIVSLRGHDAASDEGDFIDRTRGILCRVTHPHTITKRNLASSAVATASALPIKHCVDISQTIEACHRAGLQQWQILFGPSTRDNYSSSSGRWSEKSARTHTPKHDAACDLNTVCTARREFIRVSSVLRVRHRDVVFAKCRCAKDDRRGAMRNNVMHQNDRHHSDDEIARKEEGSYASGNGFTSLPRANARLPAAVPDTVGVVCEEDSHGTTFMQRIERDFAGCATDRFAQAVRKQRTFQSALLDLQRVFGNTAYGAVPFFLACGTALGAWREGYFIPHDTDIDVGVFYEDLCAHGQRVTSNISATYCPIAAASCLPDSTRSSARAIDACSVDRQSSDVQWMSRAVLDLLARLAVDGVFVLFDFCGTIEKGGGLELRLLHRSSRVRVDVNVYYPPLCHATSGDAVDNKQRESGDVGDDAALVKKYGNFVWHASYYEEAGCRRHGMYRYRHSPFRHALQRKRFCAKTVSPSSGCSDFIVPPVSYLVEYFGEDWQTPQEYSYREGLQSGYKNIIDE